MGLEKDLAKVKASIDSIVVPRERKQAQKEAALREVAEAKSKAERDHEAEVERQKGLYLTYMSQIAVLKNEAAKIPIFYFIKRMNLYDDIRSLERKARAECSLGYKQIKRDIRTERRNFRYEQECKAKQEKAEAAAAREKEDIRKAEEEYERTHTSPYRDK